MQAREEILQLIGEMWAERDPDNIFDSQRCIDAVDAFEKEAVQECEAWRRVAVDSNKAIDAYLRQLDPALPEHYGMPVDGIRRTVKEIKTNASMDGYAEFLKALRVILQNHQHRLNDGADELESLRGFHNAAVYMAERFGADAETFLESLQAWKTAP